jgi:hypothetical protein
MEIQQTNLTPILQALTQSMEMTPIKTNPLNTYGSVQQNFSHIDAGTLYNAHGIVSPSTPNTLIAYA